MSSESVDIEADQVDRVDVDVDSIIRRIEKFPMDDVNWRIPLQSAPVWLVAIAILYDCLQRLKQIKEKNSAFCKNVVNGLMNFPTNGDETVDIIDVLLKFLDVCDKHKNDTSVTQILGSSIGGPAAQFSRDFDLTHTEANFVLDDCKKNFAVLLKTFRTVIAEIIYKHTRSYDVPQDCDGNVFLQDISNIYSELVLLPRELYPQVGKIFAEAKVVPDESYAQSFPRYDNKNPQYDRVQKYSPGHKSTQNKSTQNKSTQNKSTKDKSAQDKSAQNKSTQSKAIHHKSSNVITWGSYNPVTGQEIKKADITLEIDSDTETESSVADQVPRDPVVSDQVLSYAVADILADDGQGEFTVIRHKNHHSGHSGHNGHNGHKSHNGHKGHKTHKSHTTSTESKSKKY